MGGEAGRGQRSQRESLSADHKSWRASGVPKGLRECLVMAEGVEGRIREHRALNPNKNVRLT